MSQNDYVIANQTTPLFRADLNTALQALASNSSGATAPATTYANMLWYDTASNILKMRSEADDAWIALGTLDQSANTFTPAGVATQTTATWEAGTDTTESLVSAAKIAAAIAAIPSAAIFGGGATYQNLTASRAHSTSYQNTTGHYIFVAITAATAREVQVSVDNATWIRVGRFFDSTVDATQVSFPVPDLWYYRINGSVNDLYWAELRP